MVDLNEMIPHRKKNQIIKISILKIIYDRKNPKYYINLILSKSIPIYLTWSGVLRRNKYKTFISTYGWIVAFLHKVIDRNQHVLNKCQIYKSLSATNVISVL